MTRDSTYIGDQPVNPERQEEKPKGSPTSTIPVRKNTIGAPTYSAPGAAAGKPSVPPGRSSQAPMRPATSQGNGPAPAPARSASSAVLPRREAPPERERPRERESREAPPERERPRESRESGKQRFFPQQPRSIDETGLSQTMIEELVLKALFFAGELRGADIAHRIKLPQLIVDEVIEGLRRSKYVDLKGGGGMGVGKSGMIYTLTTFATDLMRQILDRNRYNGPAPIPMADWIGAVKLQSVRNIRIDRHRMESNFGDLIVKDYIFDGLGPAMNSGRAIFFYGPPGNGKTALCQSLVQCYEGDIWVPHALIVDDFIIRFFDSTLHKPVEDDQSGPAPDSRWVRVRRPLVVVGGELTLQTLDLIYSPDVKFYEAPFQLKATNGMLLIDDFGRQQISPKDLLNRWIVPLESDIDFLTLHTGKKLQVPFNVFVAFSTNLDPAALVDDAFLRRVRYKLAVQPPDLEQFHRIWEVVCSKKKVAYDEAAINWLIENHYQPTDRPFAACQPRDLLDQVIDIAHYRNETPELSEELLDGAARNYFVRFDK